MKLLSYLFSAWIFIGVSASSFRCLAEEAELALVLEPASITIARYDREASANAKLVARVPEGKELSTELYLQYIASPGLEVVIGAPLRGDGDIEWPLQIRPVGDAADDSAVDFRLSYSLSEPEEETDEIAPAVEKVQRMRLDVKVQPGRGQSPLDDAEFSIKSDQGEITETVAQRAFLLVRNKTKHPFTISEMTIDLPDFLAARYENQTAEVGSYETRQIPIDIEIAKGSRPKIGEWLLLVSVTLCRGAENCGESSGTAVVEHKLKVGVPGVSEVLKLLNIPSLLLMPGALILATLAMFSGVAEANQRSWLKWNGVNFWLAAITVSITIFFLLGFLRNRYAALPDFLVAFGVFDVAMLWIGCVAVGVIAAVIYRLYIGSRVWLKEREDAKNNPREHDKPVDILTKLERTGLGFYMPSYTLKMDGQKQQMFKLGFDADGDKAWIVPKIILTKLTVDEKDKKEAGQLMVEIEQANNDPNRGRTKLVAEIRTGLKKKWIGLDWETGYARSPMLVAEGDLGDPGPAQSPVTTL